jgi:glycosyltransferase involved in cell wall biosynthesis
MVPFLSIITATYNSEKTLDKTIRSILSQDYTDFEYIIIDGNSKDDTIKIIKYYEPIFKEKNISYRWISELDSGIYNAWNKGLCLAIGDWIAFLGSDDTYNSKALQYYSNTISKNRNVDFIHSKVKIYKEAIFIREINKKWNWKHFKKRMNIAHAGAFHNRHYFDKHGNFNEGYRIAGDYEMLLRAKDKLNTIFLNEYTVIMQEGGISSRLFSIAFNEAEKAKIETAGIGYVKVKIDSLNLLFRYFGGKLWRNLKSK